ncbi:hypothetical protein GALMADRAFT_1354771 [Galerina marginata CBS 339.88]|uniref:Uncharacterized protein n=1 Tax=Galerina marginata (strain CBS 339.88) TaxID=685588 RepID=A0A067SE64_GALM3|nr:hypothetical protein GALMADRAFT_1354771 [Galerina marginata CBS 339.88]
MSTTIAELREFLADPSLPESLYPVLTALIAEEQINQSTSTSSTVNWKYFVSEHGEKFNPPLVNDYLTTMIILPTEKTPSYDLPLSFHTRLTMGAWPWMDVYGEKGSQMTEGDTLRLLDPFLIPLIALFRGRIINMPEEPTPESTGGKVKHEILVIEGAVFIIIELKHLLTGAPFADYVAQLFLAILSAVNRNSKYDLNTLKVHGLLSDFTTFKFFKYDPKTKIFFNDETLSVGPSREHVCTDMIEVTNKIFGILLNGYIASLEVITKKSGSRDNMNNPEVSAPISLTSTKDWATALHFANQCRDKFKEEADTVTSIEERGIKALALLDKRYAVLPKKNHTIVLNHFFAL